MTKRTKGLNRWVLGLAILEAVLGTLMYVMGPDATTNPRLLFFIFVIIINLPGVIVASALGLFGNGPWGQNSQPMPGWAVIFGVSLVFYTCCLWVVHACCYRTRDRSEHKAEPGGEDDGALG